MVVTRYLAAGALLRWGFPSNSTAHPCAFRYGGRQARVSAGQSPCTRSATYTRVAKRSRPVPAGRRLRGGALPSAWWWRWRRRRCRCGYTCAGRPVWRPHESWCTCLCFAAAGWVRPPPSVLCWPIPRVSCEAIAAEPRMRVVMICSRARTLSCAGRHPVPPASLSAWILSWKTWSNNSYGNLRSKMTQSPFLRYFHCLLCLLWIVCMLVRPPTIRPAHRRAAASRLDACEIDGSRRRRIRRERRC